MDKLKLFLQTKPVYLLLLPFFFVFHGYIENYNYISASDAAILCLKYLLFSSILLVLFYLLYKSWAKASLLVLLLLAFNLFFGATYDFLKKITNDSFLVKYTVLLPVIALLLLVIIIYLKRTKKKIFPKTFLYLNTLFLLLIILDAGRILLLNTKNNPPPVSAQKVLLTDCDSCAKPDIYLIVADEYASNKQLKSTLSFDNSQFSDSLTNRGFHIMEDASSNYNSTPFSIASLFTMNYIDSLGNKFTDESMNRAYKQINENSLTNWLKKQGYQIINNSVFHFGGITNPVNSAFFITGTDLITLNTFTGRFNRDIRFNFITRLKIKSEIRKFVQDKLDNNNELITRTIKESEKNSSKPRFVYLHTMMPHFPYLMDKDGRPDYNASFLTTNRFNQPGYIGYLQFSNKIFLDLIDKIQNTNKNSIIIFMGDHGFRHLEGDNKGHFMNFNSVYLPDKNYNTFYNNMSMVNEFRVLLNTQFNQQIPLLKDSSVFLINWW